MKIVIICLKFIANKLGYTITPLSKPPRISRTSTNKLSQTTKNIKKLLLDKNICQRDLTEVFKISKAEVSNAIAGRKRPILQQKIYDYLKSL